MADALLMVLVFLRVAWLEPEYQTVLVMKAKLISAKLLYLRQTRQRKASQYTCLKSVLISFSETIPKPQSKGDQTIT